jgi:hypothetical protein
LKDQTKPRNHIRSVFDLGLIILDEAFNVFFDRTKTADKRPQVLDIFAESIGKVVSRQSQKSLLVSVDLLAHINPRTSRQTNKPSDSDISGS